MITGRKTTRMIFVLSLLTVLIFASFSFASAENQWNYMFHTDILLKNPDTGNFEKVGDTTCIGQLNDYLANHPGSGDIVIKTHSGWREANIDSTIVIPEGAEYNIKFDIPNSRFDLLTDSHKYSNEDGYGSVLKIEADNVTIDLNGLKIEGRRDGSDYGGLAYVTGDNVTIKNFYAEGTHADYYGGGIYVEGQNCHIEDSTFAGCSAKYGGAVYIEKGYENCHISNCHLNQCNSTKDGAAVYTNAENTYIENNCQFNNNSSNDHHGDALYINNDCCYVSDTTFAGATVTSELCYVAMYCDADVKFTKCTFKNNRPADGYDYYMDVWGYKNYTKIIKCTSDNPSEYRFYKCDVSDNIGTILSEGSVWIIGAIALIAVCLITVLLRKKKVNSN